MTQLGYFFATIFCLLSIASNFSHAGMIRSFDFEDGKLGPADSNPYLTQSGNDPELVTAQNGVNPRAGKYMMRTYLNRETSSTNFRTEVTVNSPGSLDKGKAYWISVSVFLPKDWNLNYGSKDSDGIVWQFHDRSYKDPNWRQILPLTAMHTQEGWLIRNHYYPTLAINKSKGLGNLVKFSKVVPYKLGQWNDFVMNVKFSGAQSENDTNGFIKLWINGEQILNLSGQNFFGEQTYGPYFKFGLYNSAWKYTDRWTGPSSRLLYHDEIKIGDANSSYAEVAPGSSAPSGNVTAPPSPPSNLLAD
jgi:hypothetical protein